MFKSSIENIQTNANALAESKTNLIIRFRDAKDREGKSFDISRVIPESEFSLIDLDVAIETIVTFAREIKLEAINIAVPKSLLDNFAGKLSEIKNQIDGIISAFDTPNSQGGLKSLDAENITLISQNNSVTNLGKSLRRLYPTIDAALSTWYQLNSTIEGLRVEEFGSFANSIKETQTQAAVLYSQAQKSASEAGGERQKIAESFAKVVSDRNEIERLLKEVQNDRKTLNEYAAEGTTKIAEIQNSHQSAANLSSSVNEYQVNFKRFDEQLKAREEKFVKENVTLEEIHKNLDLSQKEIARLIGQSEGMLRGATNAGLAASFSSLQEKINSELGWARFSFYVSIFMLMVLSIPIAVYVFPGLGFVLKGLTGIDISIVLPKGADAHQPAEMVAQVAARALLLVPGVWLVRFTSARHERLFRLREHYSYKYSIASSVEGFKKQAPDLEQGIAATAFYELTFNPATRMDANSADARHPNPVMEWFMNKLGGSTDVGGAKS